MVGKRGRGGESIQYGFVEAPTVDPAPAQDCGEIRRAYPEPYLPVASSPAGERRFRLRDESELGLTSTHYYI